MEWKSIGKAFLWQNRLIFKFFSIKLKYSSSFDFLKVSEVSVIRLIECFSFEIMKNDLAGLGER